MNVAETISMIDEIGRTLDTFTRAEIMGLDNDTVIGTVERDEINGIQAGLSAAMCLLKGTFNPSNAREAASHIVVTYTQAKYRLDPRKHGHTEYVYD